MQPQVARISLDRAVASLAARQHGIATPTELLAAGLTSGQIRHRLRGRRLHPLYRGVYAVGHTKLDKRGRWLAAVRACGNGAVLSHRSAASLWDLRPSSASRIEVSVRRGAGRKAPAGITLHRPQALVESETVICDAIPVTTVSRTLLDLAALLAPDHLRRAIDRAEQLRRFDLNEIEATLARNANRAGTPELRRLIAERREPDFTRSELEDRFLALARAHSLPSPAVNARIHGHEVDFLWRERKLIVETDGRAAHTTHAAFERDRARDAHLTALGHRVARFSYRQVIEEPATVARLLAQLLYCAP